MFLTPTANVINLESFAHQSLPCRILHVFAYTSQICLRKKYKEKRLKAKHLLNQLKEYMIDTFDPYKHFCSELMINANALENILTHYYWISENGLHGTSSNSLQNTLHIHQDVESVQTSAIHIIKMFKHFRGPRNFLIIISQNIPSESGSTYQCLGSMIRQICLIYQMRQGMFQNKKARKDDILNST